MKQTIISTITERIENGVDYLTDVEALSTLTGIPMLILQDTITAYGYHGLIKNIDMLTLNHDERIKLELVYNISQRICRAEYKERGVISSPDDIAQLFVNELQFSEVEVFSVAFLDTRCQLIKLEKISRGTVGSAVIQKRDVIRRAILYNASSVIISHNHPSGNCKPSKNDISTTKALYLALSLLDVKLLDHIIIGNNSFFSLKSEGLF
ncbi:MAG: JAB domain-containing protein [Saccharofermentanales bacterium]